MAGDARAVSNHLHTITTESFPVSLRGATDEPRSAFSNLATNAARYTTPGGTIRITFSHPRKARSFPSPTAARASRQNTCRA